MQACASVRAPRKFPTSTSIPTGNFKVEPRSFSAHDSIFSLSLSKKRNNVSPTLKSCPTKFVQHFVNQERVEEGIGYNFTESNEIDA